MGVVPMEGPPPENIKFLFRRDHHVKISNSCLVLRAPGKGGLGKGVILLNCIFIVVRNCCLFSALNNFEGFGGPVGSRGSETQTYHVVRPPFPGSHIFPFGNGGGPVGGPSEKLCLFMFGAESMAVFPKRG